MVDMASTCRKRNPLLLVALSLLLTGCTRAIDGMVGDWTLAAKRAGAIQLARLEIHKDSGQFRATLASELGDAQIGKGE